MNVVLVSTYEMGRQPFGLASPAAWLRREGATVTCVDLAKQLLPRDALRQADLICFYIPMHTATRIAVRAGETVKKENPGAHLCFYGLYAPVNESYLRKLGAQTVLGGEFEEGLVSLYRRLSRGEEAAAGVQPEPRISLAKQKFILPDRSDLVPLAQYAKLLCGDGEKRVVGHTEASRGCKHFCRHCPIVPVYGGNFRIVQRDVVLADIRQQVEAGAEHITFGDPDFFNGIGHALALVKELHAEFPRLTYDATIKIEHLRQFSEHLTTLRDTGCLFVTSAVESVEDRVLQLLCKGHTREDFVWVVQKFREVGLELAPTFVAFTPWTTLDNYLELLALLVRLDLVENVAPIQLAIRLLIPAGSKLLELPEVLGIIEGFDEAALSYRWRHPDPRMDRLRLDVQEAVKRGEQRNKSRREIFAAIWRLAHETADRPVRAVPDTTQILPRSAIPYLNEPWYC